MFRGLVSSLQFWKGTFPKIKSKPPRAPSSNPKTATLNLMADKLRVMQETIGKTSPRSFSLFFILSTLPTFYFVKKMLQAQYNDEMFYTRIRQTLNYYYLKNLFLLSSVVTLCAFRFVNPGSKFTITAALRLKFLGVPIVASVIGLSLPSDWLSRLILVPALTTEITSLVTTVNLAAEGVLPFWYYNFKHYIQLFDLLVFIICYFAISRLQKQMAQKPYDFRAEVKSV